MRPEKRALSLFGSLSFPLTLSLPLSSSLHPSPSTHGVTLEAIRGGLGRSGSTDNYLSSMFNRRPVFRIGTNDGV